MISVYTDKNHLDKTKEYIESVDAYFDYYILKHRLGDECNLYLRAIDNSRLLSGEKAVETVYGITDLTHISTGCKGLILLHYLGDSVVLNATEFGNNVTNYISQHFESACLYSKRQFLLSGLKEKKLMFNNRVCDYYDCLDMKWGVTI